MQNIKDNSHKNFKRTLQSDIYIDKDCSLYKTKSMGILLKFQRFKMSIVCNIGLTLCCRSILQVIVIA